MQACSLLGDVVTDRWKFIILHCYNIFEIIRQTGGDCMARQNHRRSTPGENLRMLLHAIPWRLLIILPILIIAAIPAFTIGVRLGGHVLPGVTNIFYILGGPPAGPAPTPLPPFPRILPQPGSLLYTVQAGDSCDEILAFHMRMSDAGQIFSDANPRTVQALDAAIGQDCHKLQPGMVLTLSPQYPLLAFGGVVLKIAATSPQQVLPTPLVHVAPTQQIGVDCSSGCQLTVRIAPGIQVYLNVQTTIPVRIGSWVWAQAMYGRKAIHGFDNYPYVDPTASLNGMPLRACDLQVDNTHDSNSLSCDQLLPNTIDDDGGSWLFSVTGRGALDHWRYPLHLPPGTPVLLWLSLNNNGNLVFHKGDPAYRYDDNSHLYVKI